MRGRREAGARAAHALPMLAAKEALDRQPHLPDFVMRHRRPPVIFPLPDPEALACVGGGDTDDPYKRLLDAMNPFNPPPDPWPPDHTWTI